MSKEFICKGCKEKFNKDMQSNNVDYCYICNEFYTKKYIADLESKIAEKEKEIEKAKITNDRLYKKNKKLFNQIVESNIRFYKKGAVEKLEKVKWIVEDIQCNYGDDNNISRDFLIKEIDNQIKQLKGE